METTAAKLSSHLLDRKVKGFTFFNTNDEYFIFDPEKTWIFDTGVQIDFENGFFSFGRNMEFEAFDYSAERTMHELQAGNERLYTIDPEQTATLEKLHGATVTHIDFDWDYYQEFDEFAQLKEEKIYTPVGIRLTFDNDQKLQLAAVRYGFSPETRRLTGAHYTLEGSLLVSFNEEIEVAGPDNQ